MIPSSPALLLRPQPKLIAAGGSSLTFTAADVAQAWQTAGNSPFTFNCNIGTAASDRIVVVSTFIDASAVDVTDVKVNGSASLTLVASYAHVNGFQQAMYASAPGAVSGSGTQAVVITTVNAFPQGIECMVGTITGSASATVGSTNNVPAATSSDPHSISIASVPANGVAVIIAQIDATATSFSWTGTSSAGGDGFVTSLGGNLYRAAIAHGTSNSVTFTGGGAGRIVGSLMASWGP